MSYHFVLKRTGSGYDDIYEALKSGEKTSEWRDATGFWISRLFKKNVQRTIERQIKHYEGPRIQFHKTHYKHMKARFVVGYTKSPMLMADVIAIIFHTDTNQFEVQIENVEEFLTKINHFGG